MMSNLNGGAGGGCLDIYTEMDWLMSYKWNDATSFDWNENHPIEGWIQCR